MTEQACRECHRIVTGSTCSVCGSNSLSTDWSGFVVIIDPSRSCIAKKLNINIRGKYVLKVR